MDSNNWQQILFSGKGRIRRSQYWLWSVLKFIFFAIIYSIAGMITGSSQQLMAAGTIPPAMIVVYLVCIPLSIYMGACIGAKRWHDRDRSGWMYLILFIPLVGVIWNLVECGCLDGTQGPNQYGPSPKGIQNPEKVF